MNHCTDKKAHRSTWVVVNYRCNYSAFNGYKRTPSAYSEVKCETCGHRWRTKADYVHRLRRLFGA